MKIRQGFVSNSSSSSFVVIGNENPSFAYFDKYKDQYITLGLDGETEFGWDNVKYSGVDTRINFAYLQTSCGENKEWLQLLENTIMNYTGATSIDWRLTEEWDTNKGYVHGYIDHQSHTGEGKNTEIFENEEVLTRFLFSNDSYIQGGNDN